MAEPDAQPAVPKSMADQLIGDARRGAKEEAHHSESQARGQLLLDAAAAAAPAFAEASRALDAALAPVFAAPDGSAPAGQAGPLAAALGQFGAAACAHDSAQAIQALAGRSPGEWMFTGELTPIDAATEVPAAVAERFRRLELPGARELLDGLAARAAGLALAAVGEPASLPSLAIAVLESARYPRSNELFRALGLLPAFARLAAPGATADDCGPVYELVGGIWRVAEANGAGWTSEAHKYRRAQSGVPPSDPAPRHLRWLAGVSATIGDMADDLALARAAAGGDWPAWDDFGAAARPDELVLPPAGNAAAVNAPDSAPRATGPETQVVAPAVSLTDRGQTLQDMPPKQRKLIRLLEADGGKGSDFGALIEGMGYKPGEPGKKSLTELRKRMTGALDAAGLTIETVAGGFVLKSTRRAGH